MMIIVVVIYAVCWLPLHVLTICLDAYPSLYTFSHIQQLWVTCHFIAMSSLCYNPFVYFYMSSKFSDALLRFCCMRALMQLFGKKQTVNPPLLSHQMSTNKPQNIKLTNTARPNRGFSTCVSKVNTSSVLTWLLSLTFRHLFFSLKF